MGSRNWKVVLWPPLSALSIYLITTYLLLPVWRRMSRSRTPPIDYTTSFSHNPNDAPSLLPPSYSTPPRFHPLSLSAESVPLAGTTPSSSPAQALHDLAGRISTLLGRRPRAMSAGEEGFLGDEELEEGSLGHDGGGGGGGGGAVERGGGRFVVEEEQSTRRLSRDLERGFMDDSSDEEEDGETNRDGRGNDDRRIHLR